MGLNTTILILLRYCDALQLLTKKTTIKKPKNGHSTGIVQFIALDRTEQVFALDRDLEVIDLSLVASI